MYDKICGQDTQIESILFRKASGSNSSMHLASLESSTISSSSALLQFSWWSGGMFINSSMVELGEISANLIPMSCGELLLRKMGSHCQHSTNFSVTTKNMSNVVKPQFYLGSRFLEDIRLTGTGHLCQQLGKDVQTNLRWFHTTPLN